MKWILRAKGLSFGHYKQQWFGKSRLKRSNRFCEVMERKIMLSMFLDAWQMKHQTGRKYVQALQFQSWDVWNTLKCVWFAASCSTAGLDLRWSQWSCFLRKARSTWLAQRLILMTLGCHFEVTRWIIDDIHEVHEDIIYIYSSLWWNWPHFVLLDTWEANYHDMDGAFRGCMMRHTDFVEMTAPLFLDP